MGTHRSRTPTRRNGQYRAQRERSAVCVPPENPMAFDRRTAPGCNGHVGVFLKRISSYWEGSIVFALFHHYQHCAQCLALRSESVEPVRLIISCVLAVPCGITTALRDARPPHCLQKSPLQRLFPAGNIVSRVPISGLHHSHETVHQPPAEARGLFGAPRRYLFSPPLLPDRL